MSAHPNPPIFDFDDTLVNPYLAIECILLMGNPQEKCHRLNTHFLAINYI